MALFQVGSIAVIQLSAVDVTARLGARGPLVIAAFLIIPQVVVALISPAIGRATARLGTRLVLLAGFVTVPIRGALFATVRNPYALIPVQVLEGAGGATFGIMMPLVAADLTRKSGHYTTCLSLLGLAGGAGTAISTALAGGGRRPVRPVRRVLGADGGGRRRRGAGLVRDARDAGTERQAVCSTA